MSFMIFAKECEWRERTHNHHILQQKRLWQVHPSCVLINHWAWLSNCKQRDRITKMCHSQHMFPCVQCIYRSPKKREIKTKHKMLERWNNLTNFKVFYLLGRCCIDRSSTLEPCSGSTDGYGASMGYQCTHKNPVLHLTIPNFRPIIRSHTHIPIGELCPYTIAVYCCTVTSLHLGMSV